MSKEVVRMNSERYGDTTAEAAIGHVTKEEKLIEKIEQMCERYGYKVKSIKLERIERG